MNSRMGRCCVVGVAATVVVSVVVIFVAMELLLTCCHSILGNCVRVKAA